MSVGDPTISVDVRRRMLMANLTEPNRGDIATARFFVAIGDKDGDYVEPEWRAIAALTYDGDEGWQSPQLSTERSRFRRQLIRSLDKPWHGDIYSARLLVLMADQEGEEIEPELRALAGILVEGETGEDLAKHARRKSSRGHASLISPIWDGVAGGLLGVVAAVVLKMLGVW